MSVVDILTLSSSFLIIGVWFALLHVFERDARRRLGDDVVEIRLYRRWGYAVQGVMMALAIIMPVACIVVAVVEQIAVDEALSAFGRTLWIGSLLYGLRKGSVLLIGTRGLSLGLKNQIMWNRLEGIEWDRDIGQQLWGLTLTARDPKRKRLNRQRIYIRRDLKDELNRQLNHFRSAGTIQGPVVNPVPSAPAARVPFMEEI